MRIYNCIFVNQGHDVLDKEYSRTKNVNNVDTGMKLVVYTWFPYKSSNRCTDVNDITLLEGWVISPQGHFTKNTDMIPGKVSKNLKGCPMKAVVRNCDNVFTTKYINYKYLNGHDWMYINVLEMDLLQFVLQHMNMTFVHVTTPQVFELEKFGR